MFSLEEIPGVNDDKSRMMRFFPVRCKHGVNDEVDVVIVQPLTIAENSFFCKPKPFRNRPAFQISRSTTDFDPMKTHPCESIFDKRPA